MAIMLRAFFERLLEMSPRELFECSLKSNGTLGNYLVVTATNQLAVDAGYSGPAYTFSGPADPTAVPKQLGFAKGDLIVLEGPLGTEPNHGKELVLENPATITVMGTPLINDSPTLYKFRAMKRRA
jgi:hypothetical protein